MEGKRKGGENEGEELITQAAVLAKNLGMVREETEGKTGAFRSYWKTISIPGGLGKEVLTVQTVGQADTKRTERIMIGVVLGESQYWRNEANLTPGMYGAAKEELASGGYDQILSTIKKMETAGELSLMLTEIVARRDFGRKVLLELLLEMGQALDRWAFLNMYDKFGEIYLLDQPERGKKMVSVARVTKLERGITIETSRTVFNLANPEEIRSMFIRQSNRKTIYQPEPTRPGDLVGHYDQGDIEEAKIVVKEAARVLKQYGSGK